MTAAQRIALTAVAALVVAGLIFFGGYKYRDVIAERDAAARNAQRQAFADSISAALWAHDLARKLALAKSDSLEAKILSMAAEDKPRYIYLGARDKWDSHSGADAMRFLVTRPDSLWDAKYPGKAE